MLSYSRSWFDAWVETAYGAEGFWSNNRPEQHFRTAASSTPLLATMVAALLDRPPRIRRVVDVGAGNGSLLAGLAGLGRTEDLRGLDLRARPDGLDDRVGWSVDQWDVRYGRWTTGGAAEALEGPDPTLVVCCEWLDDLPCPLVARGPDGWREVVVDDGGAERPGPRLGEDDQAWADRWWPSGERAEIGRTRDIAWSWAVEAARATGGAALLIDYGHRVDERPLHGSFTAYRAGRRVPPVPAPDLNLTAHLAVDATRAAGEAAGADTVFCCLQSEAVPELLHPELHPDPLSELARRSQQAALGSAGVWGAHWWLLQR